MGLFGNVSPLDQHIDKATSDKNTSEDWSIILDVCDKVKEYSDGSKDFIRGITRKLNSDNPRVVLQAITLLDACINNCGRGFLLEVASRDFEKDLRTLITSPRTHKKVSNKLLQCLKTWAEGEFKDNPQLSLIPALYSKLQQEGFDFNASSESPKKKKVEYSEDPNVVNNKQEEDDIAQAIQMSLQTAGGAGSKSSSSNYSNNRSLYPSDLASNLDSLHISDTKGGAGANGGSSATAPAANIKKARALYDFEAVEDNELTFQAGELIVVIDSSDPNWWKGSNQRGEGLFPANFVSLDIHGDLDQPPARNEKRVSFSECVKVTEVEDAGEEGAGAALEAPEPEDVSVDIDEDKINLLLHLLHEADPTGERPDDPQLPMMEARASAMAPTIDAELESIDKRHNELAKLNNDLMEGLNLYHQLMREMPVNPPSVGYYPAPPYGAPPGMDPAGGGLPPHMMQPGLHMPHPHMGQPQFPPMYMMPPGQHSQMGAPVYGGPPGPQMGAMPPLTQGGGPVPATTTTAANSGAVYPPQQQQMPPITAAPGGDGNAAVITTSENTSTPPNGVMPSYGHCPADGSAPGGQQPQVTFAPPYASNTNTMSPHHQPNSVLHQHHMSPPGMVSSSPTANGMVPPHLVNASNGGMQQPPPPQNVHQYFQQQQQHPGMFPQPLL